MNETTKDMMVIHIGDWTNFPCAESVCGRKATRVVKLGGHQYGTQVCGRHVSWARKQITDNQRIR